MDYNGEKIVTTQYLTEKINDYLYERGYAPTFSVGGQGYSTWSENYISASIDFNTLQKLSEEAVTEEMMKQRIDEFIAGIPSPGDSMVFMVPDTVVTDWLDMEVMLSEYGDSKNQICSVLLSQYGDKYLCSIEKL